MGIPMTTKTSRTVHHIERTGRRWTTAQGEPGPYGSLQKLDSNNQNTVTYGSNFSDWKSRIRRRANATTLLSGEKYEFNCSNGGYCYVKQHANTDAPPVNYRFCEVRGAFVDFSASSPADPSGYFVQSVKNKVIQDVNRQIRQAQQDLQSLVSLGESGETVRMLNGVGKALFAKTDDYLRDLSKAARHLTPQNVARTISEKWLGYRLGVLPLVSDAQGYYNSVNRLREGSPPAVLVRASANSTEKELSLKSSFTYLDIRIDCTTEKSREYGYKLYGAVSLEGTQSPTLHSSLGLTLREFVPTVYELIPYSFLVDYFLNLGAVIDAFALNRSGLKWMAEGEKRASVVRQTSVVQPEPATPNWTIDESSISPSGPLYRSRTKVLRHIAGPGTYIPSLEFTIPGSSTQWLNTAALAHLHLDASERLKRVQRRRR